MDIQQIRYFLTVAKYESFSKAAEKLFVTQPILTRCVKNLEQELGTPLILRSTRRFALTDAGQTLVQYGSQLLQQHQDLYRRIADVTHAQTGEITISSPGVLLDMYFPELVTKFRRSYPGIHIRIRERGSRPVAEDLRDGAADIGLVMLPLEDQRDFHCFPIVSDEVHVLLPRDHLLAARDHIPICLLKDQELITYSRSTTLYHTFQELCREADFTPTIVFQSMMPNFILDTISCGTCIGILPGPMLRQFRREDLVSIPLRPRFPWQIALIAKKDRYLSHAAQCFLDFAQAYFVEKRIGES